jgi:2-furoyl-CoA dehydrogenase FAD binding subunit
MKPAPFDYVRAETREEALTVLDSEGAEARVLAGGQSLVPMLNMRLARPRVLVDISRVAELARISERRRVLTIGAAVRQAELEAKADLHVHQPLIAAALPWVGHMQTRARGTVCGSIAHADPSAELPLVLLALGGEVHLRSRRRSRRVQADAFFTGMMATVRRDDELIESISFPAQRPGIGAAFREIARRHGDFAIVACAAMVEAHSVRLAVGGVADRPQMRLMPASLGSDLDDALDAFAWALEARDDLHASARYRRELVRRIGRQTIERARRDAEMKAAA